MNPISFSANGKYLIALANFTHGLEGARLLRIFSISPRGQEISNISKDVKYCDEIGDYKSSSSFESFKGFISETSFLVHCETYGDRGSSFEIVNLATNQSQKVSEEIFQKYEQRAKTYGAVGSPARVIKTQEF